MNIFVELMIYAGVALLLAIYNDYKGRGWLWFAIFVCLSVIVWAFKFMYYFQ